jgi:hypothetical protein
MEYKTMEKSKLINMLLDRGMGEEISLYPESKWQTISFIQKFHGIFKGWDGFDARDNHEQWVKELETLTKDQLIQIAYFSQEDYDNEENMDPDNEYEEFYNETYC